MKRPMTLVLLLLLVPETWLAAGPSQERAALPAAAPRAEQAAPPNTTIESEEAGSYVFTADTGQYLPDNTVLARVNQRIVHVIDFRRRYFSSEALSRPAADSLGRIEFLNSMINKDVMGLTALAINRPLTFEDRLILRQFSSVAIQNVMHQRVVLDSISVTEEDLRAVFPQYMYEQHLRGILFEDRATAERVRADLVAGRISWKNAVRRYSQDSSRDSVGDLGWVTRWTVSGDFALKGFSIAPGGISEVVDDADGYRLLQSVERRAVSPPGYGVMRRYIDRDLRGAASSPRVQRLFQSLRAEAGVTYDTTNIKWAISRFREASQAMRAEQSHGIDLRDVVPRVDPADTGRVLARTKDRRFTVGEFVRGYVAIPVVLRRSVVGIVPFVFTLDGMFLEPEMIARARAGGFDRDSLAVAMIEHRREELLVEHLFEDSILSRVSVTPAKRKRYYQEHRKEFVSRPRAHYARFVRPSDAAADSLVARLRAGESAEAIMAADSLRGETGGSIENVAQNQAQSLEQVLFEELRPGQAAKTGPDRNGHFIVVKLLRHEEPRPMAYEEVERIVDESVQNIEAERLLKEFIARHRRPYQIEAHPELVMQIRLIDPALEVRLN